jgi:hypothetical protein
MGDDGTSLLPLLAKRGEGRGEELRPLKNMVLSI